jgi:hypothetical protein
MRLILALAVVLAATPAVAQQSGDVPPAVKNAETCLRQNAAAAVAASSGAADAAGFLMDYLCAGPVEAAARHARNTQTLILLREMQASSEMAVEEDWLAGALVDPTTGDLEIKAKSEEAQGMLIAMQMMSGIFGGAQSADPRPIALRELAGRLVQEARARP